MDWTSLIGPAVVAAGIAGIVSVITLVMNRATTLKTHSQRLAFDREQAERKVRADIALAEKKLALDRELAAWRRRTEFAEEVLTDFYQAQDVIMGARSPGIFESEGKTRPRGNHETEDETRKLDAYFAITERLSSKQEFFAQLHARRYRFMAYFGTEAAKPYGDLHQIYAEIVVSVRMLLETYRQREFGSLPDDRRRWEAVIWDIGPDDPIRARLGRIIEAIEATCGPVIREIAQ
jgi:hypothetical protein